MIKQFILIWACFSIFIFAQDKTVNIIVDMNKEIGRVKTYLGMVRLR